MPIVSHTFMLQKVHSIRILRICVKIRNLCSTVSFLTHFCCTTSCYSRISEIRDTCRQVPQVLFSFVDFVVPLFYVRQFKRASVRRWYNRSVPIPICVQYDHCPRTLSENRILKVCIKIRVIAVCAFMPQKQY